ncbi:MAG: hypothetical protein JSV59_04210 [Flavobacteriaceae bacterium]|nr:MAG: hypothetical protein JSV59_04210 [Flavobacteriaceae bacterium]
MTLKQLLSIGILISGIGASFPPIINLDITQKVIQPMRRETVHDSKKNVVAGRWICITHDINISQYFAPLQTEITICNHLEFTNGKGEKVILTDIYGYAY